MKLILTYLLNLFDLAMTTLWVNRYGLSVEANPIGRWMYASNAVPAVKIFAVGVALAVMGLGIRKHPKLAWVAYISLVVYAVVAVYHIIIFILIGVINNVF